MTDGPEALTPSDGVANNQAVVVIAGMHRSGTSLMASVFGGAGVDIGERLDGPGKGNRWGHFEDLEFRQLHDGVFRRVGKTFLTATPADLDPPTAEELELARALVARRREHRLWGWKDPRTCLFLDFWHPLLANPRYVFIYRHPIEVALSLLRRGGELDLEALENPAVCFESWRIHNQAILDFYRRHHQRCVLGHIRSLTADLDRAIKACASKLALPLASGGARHLYHPEDLSEVPVSPEALATLMRLMPEVIALYERLEETADLPEASVTHPSVGCPRPRAVAERTGAATSGGGLAREVLSCLARVDLEAVLAARDSLDAIRRGHRIHALEAERQEHLAGAADSRAAQERLGASHEQALRHAAEAQTRAAEQEKRAGGLAEALSVREAQHRAAQAEVVELAARNAQLIADVSRLERTRIELDARVAQIQDQLSATMAEAAGAQARADDLAGRLALAVEEARQLIVEAEATSEAHRARADRLETSATLLAREREDRERLLAAIQQTRAWRAAQQWYAFKRAASRLLRGHEDALRGGRSRRGSPRIPR